MQKDWVTYGCLGIIVGLVLRQFFHGHPLKNFKEGKEGGTIKVLCVAGMFATALFFSWKPVFIWFVRYCMSGMD